MPRLFAHGVLTIFNFNVLYMHCQTVFMRKEGNAKFIIWCNRVEALLHALLYGKEKGGDELKRAYRYLTFEDRKQIERLWSEGATPKEIACTLGVHFTTVYDELKRGDTGQVYADFRNVYDASLAQQTVKDSLKRKGRHRQAV